MALLIVPSTTYAQSYLKRTVGAVEVDLSVGLVTATNKMVDFGRSRQGVEVGAEVRYNFYQAPVDLGLQFSLCTFNRGERTNNTASNYSFNSQTLLITSDYNFFQTRLASLFVGMGAGCAWNNINQDNTRSGFNPCVAPRIGVEIANHLRITATYKFYEKANNHLLLSVGFAFGGGKR